MSATCALHQTKKVSHLLQFHSAFSMYQRAQESMMSRVRSGALRMQPIGIAR